MFTRPEGQRLAGRDGPRPAPPLATLATLAALVAFAACVRQPAAAVAREGAAPADTAAATLAYECALNAVIAAGLFVTDTDPRRGSLRARSSLAVPGPGRPGSSESPVDFLAVRVKLPKTQPAGPVVGVSATTLVPRYHSPAGGRAGGVTWTQVMLSSRAISARRAVLERCSGDTTSGARAGA